jgi:hypothetical protein
MIQSGENEDRPTIQTRILIRSEKVQHDPRIVSVRHDPMHSTTRHNTNRGQYNTIRLYTANPTQYDTNRERGLQYNTYNHVHTICIFPWGVQYVMIRYDTIRTTSDTMQYIHGKPRTVRPDANRGWYNTIGRTVQKIRGSYCISSGSTVRYDTIQTAINTIQYIRQTPHSTIRQDTTEYEPRVIGLQYNTYMYGKYNTIGLRVIGLRVIGLRVIGLRVIGLRVDRPTSDRPTSDRPMSDRPTIQYIHVRQIQYNRPTSDRPTIQYTHVRQIQYNRHTIQ